VAHPADRDPDNRDNFLNRVALLKRHQWHQQIRRRPKVIGRTWHDWLLGIGQMVLWVLISFGYRQANKAHQTLMRQNNGKQKGDWTADGLG